MSRERKPGGKSAFITVGTTQFEKLTNAICSSAVLTTLLNLGYRKVKVQIGHGKEPIVDRVPGLEVEVYRLKPSISEDINQADLVISHAGAGSCLETLAANKPLLVVINDDLMNNHQLELAYQLNKDKHLFYCTTSTLVETLSSVDFSVLKPFPPGQPQKFGEFLDNLFGFSEQKQS
ncbi:UDP-N-acetylglucosamine transferase subunit ALG13 homolog [Saccostrea echinata]|uniref:UDP-N-acetylglucosamine transferase subunit ALG13 homolog n=1 Tax=Saccostrea echinata TaxID=191078 RepID=UPI002A805271|nr:UDP-N-acetylglucosamine transferase subunit ALG13 homolog [Saccostrea echinata]XP_061179265.1 UDP-N-acetylglucosamine transferase subunit ALG13 homolog [Saccostrea echinata]